MPNSSDGTASSSHGRSTYPPQPRAKLNEQLTKPNVERNIKLEQDKQALEECKAATAVYKDPVSYGCLQGPSGSASAVLSQDGPYACGAATVPRFFRCERKHGSDIAAARVLG